MSSRSRRSVHEEPGTHDEPGAVDEPGRGQSARRGRGRVVGAVVVLVVVVAAAGITYRVLHHEPAFIDRGAVTRRVDLSGDGLYLLEPAGPDVVPGVSAADAFGAEPEQAHPGERGRPEVMFGLLTLGDSPAWVRRPAWIVLRRHIAAMSTMEPTPFFSDSLDVIDPTTGDPQALVQWTGTRADDASSLRHRSRRAATLDPGMRRG